MGRETRARTPSLWILHRLKANVVGLGLLLLIGYITYIMIMLIFEGIIINKKELATLGIANAVISLFFIKGIYPHTIIGSKSKFTGASVV